MQGRIRGILLEKFAFRNIDVNDFLSSEWSINLKRVIQEVHMMSPALFCSDVIASATGRRSTYITRVLSENTENAEEDSIVFRGFLKKLEDV